MDEKEMMKNYGLFISKSGIEKKLPELYEKLKMPFLMIDGDIVNFNELRDVLNNESLSNEVMAEVHKLNFGEYPDWYKPSDSSSQ